MSQPEAQSTNSYERARRRSYKVLEQARLDATNDPEHHYDSVATRQRLQSTFSAKFGKPAYDWQLDVAESLFLGLDTVLIAGTGAGKTMPFMMPLLLDSAKKVLVISPLKVQHDQAERFKKMGISAVAINGDSWVASAFQQDVSQGKYRALFAGPEMSLEHESFRDALRAIAKDIAAVIIDEAHCISQWGGDFRKHYAELNKLRGILRPGTPVLAASATLTPRALQDVCSSLLIDRDTSFFLNLGNDRPNISTSVHRMKNASDFDALKPHLNLNATTPEELPKTIIFMNTVKLTQQGARFIRNQFPRPMRKYVDYIYSHRSRRDKRKVMRRFRHGQIRILIATEAAKAFAESP
ncbi:uncharacterized protein ARMOST_16051 [Armillaria ostoyae]|uniref:DNA 3'-5' helicase n=1 Tax=Armillaria ostoyae TaxID=47428 RepID=A0A284RV48_ARMOS|nr:uncharacterized protein ARMOST_16051 [Armillaria ostoyae]